MKRLLLASAATMVMAFSPLAAQAGGVGVVNVPKVMSMRQEAQAVEAQLKSNVEAAQLKLKTKADALSQLQSELNSPRAALLSPEAKQKKEDALDQGSRELDGMKQDAQKELNRQRERLLQNIFAHLREVVDQVRQAKGLDVVLAADPAVVLSFADAADISEAVVKAFNLKYPGQAK